MNGEIPEQRKRDGLLGISRKEHFVELSKGSSGFGKPVTQLVP
jgi:hypothetical protein